MTYIIGGKIANPMRIIKLAEKNKAVYVSIWNRHTPAKWIVNMSFGIVCRWVQLGYIREIKK